VKHRTDVVGIFPNEVSSILPIGAALFERNDEWQTARSHMMVKAFAEIDIGESDLMLSIATKAA